MLPWKRKNKNNNNNNNNNSNSNLSEEKYTMKDKYEANKLCVANFEYVSSEVNEACTPMCHMTDLKYIFEILQDGEKVKYREIFTGYITEDFSECSIFDKPYVSNIEPFIDYFPYEKDKEVYKLSMLLRIDYINKERKNKVKTKTYE